MNRYLSGVVGLFTHCACLHVRWSTLSLCTSHSIQGNRVQSKAVVVMCPVQTNRWWLCINCDDQDDLVSLRVNVFLILVVEVIMLI